MGQGTLPVERFKEYLVQDYLYLVGPAVELQLAHGEGELILTPEK